MNLPHRCLPALLRAFERHPSARTHLIHRLKMSDTNGNLSNGGVPVTANTLQPVLKEVTAKGLISDRTPSVDLFDMDYFGGRVKALMAAFPEPFFLHAAALKANSIRGVLLEARKKGMGAECASISEAIHALSLGFDPANVVYDSPCKTKFDIERALKSNIVINLDNDYEMAIMDELLKDSCKGSKASIGLRINPVVGGGSIAIISTATKLSKFGIPVTEDTKERVIDLYKKYEWLTGIHVHVGSQGVPMELFVKGAKVCMDFVKEIEAKSGKKISTVDIGGGLSTTYTEESEPQDFAYALYRKRLEEMVPDLFSGDRRIITEFGRSLFLKAGTTVTRIEHVKQWIPGVKPIALTHVGTNQFIRETYLPDIWRHRYSLARPDGTVKEGNKQVYDLAGPMCFQGDYLAKDVELSTVEDGDLLIIHDTGAYSMAMYSKFNSILPSPVYSFRREGDGIGLWCLKERETPEETLEFWGSIKPREV